MVNKLIVFQCGQGSGGETTDGFFKKYLSIVYFLPLCRFSEQLATWFLIVFGITLLCLTDVKDFPFYEGSGREILSLCFAANLGRYIYRIVQDFFLSEHLQHWWILSLHHIVSIFCYSTMMHFSENMWLGISGILMEANSFSFDAMWILKKCDFGKHSNIYRFFARTACGSSVLVRLVFPTCAAIYAITRQNPLAMQPLPLAILFLSVVFFLAMNIWVTKSSIEKVQKCHAARKEKELADVVISKSPDLPNLPNSTRNLLPNAAKKILRTNTSQNQTNERIEESKLRVSYNNLSRKAEKIPINEMLMAMHGRETELQHIAVSRPASFTSTETSDCSDILESKQISVHVHPSLDDSLSQQVHELLLCCLGLTQYILRSTDPDRHVFALSEEKK